MRTVKTNKILEFMKDDHDRLYMIFQKFRSVAVKNANEAENLFHDFKIGLQRHIVWEEEIMFPIFENKTGMHGTGPSVVMRDDHRQIKEILEEMHSMLVEKKVNRINKLADNLVDVLKPHNRNEENVLYSWIDNSMNKQERKDVFKELENIPAEKYNKCCE